MGFNRKRPPPPAFRVARTVFGRFYAVPPSKRLLAGAQAFGSVVALLLFMQFFVWDAKTTDSASLSLHMTGKHWKQFAQDRTDLQSDFATLTDFVQTNLPKKAGPTTIKERETKLIPRIVHQTTKDKSSLPDQIQELRDTWAAMNPGWEVKLWDDAECLQFVTTEFPEYLAAYHALPKNVERADFFRYMVILRFGGVYADIDTESMQPLDDVIRPTDALIVGWENEFPTPEIALERTYARTRQVLQWTFIGAPGHPALRAMCEHIKQHATTVFTNDIDRDTLERTGPGAFTDVLLRYSLGMNHVSGAASLTAPPATWGIRFLPMVAFGANPVGMDGIPGNAREIVILHHFIGSWKVSPPNSWPHRVYKRVIQVVQVLSYPLRLLSGPVAQSMGFGKPQPSAEQLARATGLGLGAYPVSVSWRPSFDIIVPPAGSLHSDGDSLTKWGAAQGTVAPFMHPTQAEIFAAVLQSRPAEEVVVTGGAGQGYLTLAAAATGRHVVAFSHQPHLTPLLQWSLAANSMEEQVDVREGLLHNTSGVEHHLHTLEPVRPEPRSASLHPFAHDTIGAGAAGPPTVQSLTLDETLRLASRGVDPLRVGALALSVAGQAGWALAGARRTFEAHPPAVVSVDLAHALLKDAGDSVERVLGQLGAWGYADVFHAGPGCHERWEDLAHVDQHRHHRWAEWPPQGDKYWPMTRLPRWCRLCIGGGREADDRALLARVLKSRGTAHIAESFILIHHSVKLMDLKDQYGVDLADSCDLPAAAATQGQ